MGVEPDDGETAVPRREPADRADVRAAAASEHERTPWNPARDRVGLLVERVAVHHERLGIRQLGPCRLRHRLPTVSPRAGDADEPGPEDRAAAVTFVDVVEGHGGQRPAVRATCAERAHSARSHVSERLVARMPTPS